MQEDIVSLLYSPLPLKIGRPEAWLLRDCGLRTCGVRASQYKYWWYLVLTQIGYWHSSPGPGESTSLLNRKIAARGPNYWRSQLLDDPAF
jgi:hypothetical protein